MCVCIYARMYVCACMYVCIYIYMYRYVCVYFYTCIMYVERVGYLVLLSTSAPNFLLKIVVKPDTFESFHPCSSSTFESCHPCSSIIRSFNSHV